MDTKIEKLREYMRKRMVIYRQSKKNRDWVKKYRQTQAYKDRAKKLEKKKSVIEYRKKYKKTAKWREIENRYVRNRKITNPRYKLAIQIRVRLYGAIKKESKVGSAVKDLGCSITKLKLHLENQFTDGMNWKNWGKYGWHIDHIKPLSSFDLTDQSQFLKAVHYTNLQPLWAKDNLTKGKK